MPRRSWSERFKVWRSSKLLWGVGYTLLIPLIYVGWVIFDSYRTDAIIRDWQDRKVYLTFSVESPGWLERLGPQVESFVRKGFSLRRVSGLRASYQLKFVPDKRHLFTSVDIRNLKRMTELKHLNITNHAVTDKDLSHIGRLSGLISLTIKSPDVSDAGISHLRDLQHLNHLAIDGNSRISVKGLAQLAELSALSELSLGVLPVTDEGVAEILRIRGLKALELDASHLSKTGIDRLEQIPTLERLYIKKPDRSDELLKGLEQRMQSRDKQVYFVEDGN